MYSVLFAEKKDHLREIPVIGKRKSFTILYPASDSEGSLGLGGKSLTE
jgi:hypothetical protein